jgi:hypothetical protein
MNQFGVFTDDFACARAFAHEEDARQWIEGHQLPGDVAYTFALLASN